MQRRRSESTRLFAGVVIAAAAAIGISACSPGADYPSIFPAIHDMPPPRADTPLDPVQVQQATEDLITERNHLTAEAQGPGQQGPGQKVTADPPATGANPPAAKKHSGSAQHITADGTPTSGTETK